MVLSKFLYSLVLDMFESIAVVSSNTKTHNVSQNSSWNSDFSVLKPDLFSSDFTSMKPIF